MASATAGDYGGGPPPPAGYYGNYGGGYGNYHGPPYNMHTDTVSCCKQWGTGVTMVTMDYAGLG